MHEVELALVEYVPAAHAVHTPWPAVALYLPASHVEHDEGPGTTVHVGVGEGTCWDPTEVAMTGVFCVAVRPLPSLPEPPFPQQMIELFFSETHEWKTPDAKATPVPASMFSTVLGVLMGVL